MNAKFLAFIFLTILLAFVFELVRRERLTFKYAAGWIMLTLAGIILVLMDQWVSAISAFLGFRVASNFVFFFCVVAGIFVSLFLTIFFCQQNNRNDRIVQKIGLLENEIQELKKNNDLKT
jgi:hypothetical protein